MKCIHCDIEFSTVAAKTLHFKVFHPHKVNKKYIRVVENIEKCFYAHHKDNVHQLSFNQIKDWINSNTKNGISSPRLANFLKRRPQFRLVRKFRKVGTNLTESYWGLSDDEVITPIRKTRGWVEVPVT